MQSKLQSLIEATTNTAVGFIISLASTFVIFPIVGIATSTKQNVEITLYFTVISILRSYIIRRYFNKAKPLNNTPFKLYCFECEIETTVKEVDDDMYCDNCGLNHN